MPPGIWVFLFSYPLVGTLVGAVAPLVGTVSFTCLLSITVGQWFFGRLPGSGSLPIRWHIFSIYCSASYYSM